MPHITVNGEPRRLEDGATVASLLAVLGVSPEGIAVEINREIVPRRVHANTVLADGDTVEVVTFVGGG